MHFFDISTSKSGPKLMFLSFLTWKRALRHNGVQFFISHLASWLRTCRFSEPTFRASGATIHWKNTVFRDFPTFSPICIFFLLDSFSSTLLSSNLSLLSASALLCFSSVHIVESLTSKLPSNIIFGVEFWIAQAEPKQIPKPENGCENQQLAHFFKSYQLENSDQGSKIQRRKQNISGPLKISPNSV